MIPSLDRSLRLGSLCNLYQEQNSQAVKQRLSSKLAKAHYSLESDPRVLTPSSSCGRKLIPFLLILGFNQGFVCVGQILDH